MLEKEDVNTGGDKTPSIGKEQGSVTEVLVEDGCFRGKGLGGTKGVPGSIGCTITFMAPLFSDDIVLIAALWSWYLIWLIRS